VDMRAPLGLPNELGSYSASRPILFHCAINRDSSSKLSTLSSENLHHCLKGVALYRPKGLEEVSIFPRKYDCAVRNECGGWHNTMNVGFWH